MQSNFQRCKALQRVLTSRMNVNSKNVIWQSTAVSYRLLVICSSEPVNIVKHTQKNHATESLQCRVVTCRVL